VNASVPAILDGSVRLDLNAVERVQESAARHRVSTDGFLPKKCSKKIQKSVDTQSPVWDSGGTHGNNNSNKT
jgi:hypothetical protein